jgi:hypothetical protein
MLANYSSGRGRKIPHLANASCEAVGVSAGAKCKVSGRAAAASKVASPATAAATLKTKRGPRRWVSTPPPMAPIMKANPTLTPCGVLLDEERRRHDHNTLHTKFGTTMVKENKCTVDSCQAPAVFQGSSLNSEEVRGREPCSVGGEQQGRNQGGGGGREGNQMTDIT